MNRLGKGNLQNVKNIYLNVINGVSPDKLIGQRIKRDGNKLYCDKDSHILQNNIYVVGFGKAVGGMVRKIQDLLGDHIVKGAVSLPCGLKQALSTSGKSHLYPISDSNFWVSEGAQNNIPDNDSLTCTEYIINICKNATEKDLVIALISGGGSALLCSPIEHLSLQRKQNITKLLASKGADIKELNIVRQSMSNVKGGKLAKMAFPAKVWGFVLSDIVGNPIHLIASGPTVVNNLPTLPVVFNIFKKYQLNKQIEIDWMNDADNISFNKTDPIQNQIVGSNKIAVSIAASEARLLGYNTMVLSDSFQGEAQCLGKMFAKIASLAALLSLDHRHNSHSLFTEEIALYLENQCINKSQAERTVMQLKSVILQSLKEKKPLCLIGAGETTTQLCSNPGKGGRNQEIILSAAIELCKLDISGNLEFTLLSAGTDGIDGPTDAAGAAISSTELSSFNVRNAEDALLRNDSYNFFHSSGKGLIFTGPTGTNVMDIQLLTIDLI